MDHKIATLFVRILLGLIFGMQGLGKVFKIGVSNIYNGGFKGYEETFLPTFILKFAAYFTSYAELICGFLLILGLFRKQSYYILGAVLLIVSFGHGLQNPIWDLSHVMYRSMLLVFLMMVPLAKDTISLDNKLFNRN